MKPKEWLAANGHIPKSDVNRRGRMSLAHKALIQEAVAAGAIIDGYAVVSKPTVEAEKPNVERVKPDGQRFLDCPDPIRDVREFKAYVMDDGKRKEIGNKAVCNGCRNSLPYCYCESPRVWLDHERESVVTFVYSKGVA